MKDPEFYSNQPWYVKFWRNKTLFFIPFQAFYVWICNLNEGEHKLNFDQSWSLARGLADLRRKHLVRWEDIKDRHWRNDDDNDDIKIVDEDLNDMHFDAIQDDEH